MLLKLQKRLAIKVIRGYRTISYEGALMVSGSILWTLLAEAYSSMYEFREDFRQRGELLLTPRATKVARYQFR